MPSSSTPSATAAGICRDRRRRQGRQRGWCLVGYLALTRQTSVDEAARPIREWRDWYQYFPWEDWRDAKTGDDRQR